MEKKKNKLFSNMLQSPMKRDILLMLSTSLLDSVIKMANKQFNDETLRNLHLLLNGAYWVANFNYLCDVVYCDEKDKKTIEYQNINRIYKNVLENAKQLFEKLDFKDPIAIYTAYRYMLTNGYLSNEKKMMYSNNVKDLPNLLGADIFDGRGVCRNISSLLTDLNNIMGIESYSGGARFNDDTECSKESEEVELASEYDDEDFEMNNMQRVISIITSIASLLMLPNHAITYAQFNNRGYILDPTNAIAFKSLSGRGIVALNDLEHRTKISYIIPLLTRTTTSEELKRIKKIMTQEMIGYDEYRQIWNNTLNRCNENVNMLENFYNQNAELYRDAHNELDKVKPRIKRIIPFWE